MEDSSKQTEISRNVTTTNEKKTQKSKGKIKHSKKVFNRPYPRVALEKAVAVAQALKQKNGGNPWPSEQVAAALGVSARGGAFIYLLLSSKKFGLTDGT